MMNKIIADEKDSKDEIFRKYFMHQNPSFLAKHLIIPEQSKNEQLVNNINDELIDLRNAIIEKEVTENENPNKIVDIVEKIFDFNEQRKGKARPRMLALRLSDLARIANAMRKYVAI